MGEGSGEVSISKWPVASEVFTKNITETADTVILFIGNHAGEGYDREYLGFHPTVEK
jgi:beta-glucosidase